MQGRSGCPLKRVPNPTALSNYSILFEAPPDISVDLPTFNLNGKSGTPFLMALKVIVQESVGLLLSLYLPDLDG